MQHSENNAPTRVKSGDTKRSNPAFQKLAIKQNRLLWLLLLGDLMLITLFVIHRIDFYFLHSTIPFLKDSRFGLTTEWGYSEIFQYCKELGCAGLLCAIAIKLRQRGFFVWALLFFYLFLDDSLQIHETLGAVLTNLWALHPIPGIEADGLGQAAISAAFGVPLMGGLGLAYLRGNQQFRSFSLQMGAIIAALAFCGVALDMIDIQQQTIWVKGISTIFEDGGEMIVMSVALAVTTDWLRKR